MTRSSTTVSAARCGRDDLGSIPGSGTPGQREAGMSELKPLPIFPVELAETLDKRDWSLEPGEWDRFRVGLQQWLDETSAALEHNAGVHEKR